MNNVNTTKNRFFVLIGFMAAGKTFLGREVAKFFKCDFVDLDSYIEEKELKSICEIFKQYGEDYFRKLETDLFIELIKAETDLLIVSVGGGFPLKKENQIILKDVTTVFIDTDFKVIENRLNEQEKAKRPLLKSLSNLEIKQLYEKRRKIYYNLADFNIQNYKQLINLIGIKKGN